MPEAFTAVKRASMRELSDEYEGEFLLIKILENLGSRSRNRELCQVGIALDAPLRDSSGTREGS